MSVGRICSRIVATASPRESVRVAARRMAGHRVGTLVVVSAEGVGEAVGILTDRDVVVRCIAGDLDPDTTPIEKVMSESVHTVSEGTPIEEAIAEMARGATRRLVVTDHDGRPVGVLSLDDVLDLLIEEAGSIGRLLERQRPYINA
jgi:CBS domain-containing protein